jgi:hypothetical protein
MSSYKKYILTECDTCKKNASVINNKTAIVPLRCNLTKNCNGLLTKKYKSPVSKSSFFSNETNQYVPRGTLVEEAPIINTPVSINLISGTNSIALAGIKTKAILSDNFYYAINELGADVLLETKTTLNTPTSIIFSLNLYELEEKTVPYRTYIFYKDSGTSIIEGADNSADRKVLRFTESDSIKVIVNGVELLSTEYEVTATNSIRLTPMLLDSKNIVQVLVYSSSLSEINPDKVISLKFTGQSIEENLNVLSISAWGDTQSINLPNEVFVLFCSDLSGLKIGKTYLVLGATVSGVLSSVVAPDLSKISILLGKPPYSFADKVLNSHVKLSSIVSKNLTFSVTSNNSLELKTLESTKTDLSYDLEIAKKLILIANTNADKTADQYTVSNQYCLGYM